MKGEPMNQDQMALALDDFVQDYGFDAACLALADVCNKMSGVQAAWVPELGERASTKASLWQRRAFTLAKLASAE
jgi:hypothetical protein